MCAIQLLVCLWWGAYVCHTALSVSVVGLEQALLQYCSQPQENAFDLKTVPIDAAPFKIKIQCKSHPLTHPC